MRKSTKKILTVLFLVFVISCYYQISSADEKRSRKIKVKSPWSDFNTMIKSMKLEDAVAYFANQLWSVFSPTFAGAFKAMGYFIYNIDTASNDAEEYYPTYWFDFLMIPTRKTYTDFFGYSSHSSAPYPQTHNP